MLVTAIRNFDNCVKKPHYVEGLFAGVYADQNEKVGRLYWIESPALLCWMTSDN